MLYVLKEMYAKQNQDSDDITAYQHFKLQPKSR